MPSSQIVPSGKVLRGAAEASSSTAKPYTCWGVFDGHAGDACSHFCSATFPRIFEESRSPSVALSRLSAAFEAALGKGVTWSPGTTANVVVADDDRLICANVGDSRSLLFRRGSAEAATSLSKDHDTWFREDERQR